MHPFRGSLTSKKDRGGWLHKGDCVFCKLCRQKVAHGSGTTHVILLIAIIKFQYSLLS